MKPELLDYLKNKARQSFDIDNNNCIQFTDDCFTIYHGYSLWSHLRNKNSLEEAGYSTIFEAAKDILNRKDSPEEGDFVLVEVDSDNYLGGYACGFCVGDLSVFINTKGVKYLPSNKMKFIWGIK